MDAWSIVLVSYQLYNCKTTYSRREICAIHAWCFLIEFLVIHACMRNCSFLGAWHYIPIEQAQVILESFLPLYVRYLIPISRIKISLLVSVRLWNATKEIVQLRLSVCLPEWTHKQIDWYLFVLELHCMWCSAEGMYFPPQKFIQ